MFYVKLKNEECEVKVGLTNDNICYMSNVWKRTTSRYFRNIPAY